jgi:hypothetical protein
VSRAETLAAAHDDAVQVVALDAADDPSGDARRRYGFKGAGWVLIRPDQVVAVRGESEDVASLERYLKNVVGLRVGDGTH